MKNSVKIKKRKHIGEKLSLGSTWKSSSLASLSGQRLLNLEPKLRITLNSKTLIDFSPLVSTGLHRFYEPHGINLIH